MNVIIRHHIVFPLSKDRSRNHKPSSCFNEINVKAYTHGRKFENCFSNNPRYKTYTETLIMTKNVSYDFEC